MLAVFDVFCEEVQCEFSLGRSYLNDGVYDRFSEGEVGILFQAVVEELEEHVCLLGQSVIEEGRRLDSLNFEVQSEVWQIEADLLEQLLYAIFVASFEEGADCQGRY